MYSIILILRLIKYFHRHQVTLLNIATIIHVAQITFGQLQRKKRCVRPIAFCDPFLLVDRASLDVVDEPDSPFVKVMFRD